MRTVYLGFGAVVAIFTTALLGSRRPAFAAEEVPLLSPAAYEDELALADLLWRHSAEVREARSAVGVASSEAMRARLYPNPAVDLGWNTIPLGRSNPPHLKDPIGNVPGYVIGISELIELGKRGPREAAAVAELERSRAQALSTFAARFFDLLGAIGRIAKNQVRVAEIGEQV